MAIHIVDENQLQELAKKLFEKLSLSQTLTLEGELGSGKTTFTRYLAKHIGIEEPITSPTFNLIQEYRKDSFSLIHCDLYRLEENSCLDLLGFDDYFKRDNCLIVIEWANKFKNELPNNSLNIRFEYIDENKRKITLPDKI